MIVKSRYKERTGLEWERQYASIRVKTHSSKYKERTGLEWERQYTSIRVKTYS